MKMILAIALLAIVPCAPVVAFDAWQQPARYAIEYEVDLSDLPEGSWRLWLPTPRFGFNQHELEASVDAPRPHRVTWDDRGNRMLYLEGVGPAEAPLVARYELVREPSTGLPRGEIVRNSPDVPERHLAPERRVPLDGILGDLGRQATQGVQGDVARIRAIYDYVVRTMRYAKDGQGWGRGDAVWACTSKYGNCTDFHAVLTGMARSQGIPARFLMGFPIDPTVESGEAGGYHCWIQAHAPERGWLPVDASEAWKQKRPDAYFGRVPSDRIHFTTGRDLVLSPPQAGEPLNYFIYPYVEVDGVPVDTPPWKLRFRRIPLQRGASS